MRGSNLQFALGVKSSLRLTEAAQVLVTVVKKWSWLKAWAMNIAKRRGRQRATVALARRLAAIMHRIWSDGSEFHWARENSAAVKL